MVVLPIIIPLESPDAAFIQSCEGSVILVGSSVLGGLGVLGSGCMGGQGAPALHTYSLVLLPTISSAIAAILLPVNAHGTQADTSMLFSTHLHRGVSA